MKYSLVVLLSVVFISACSSDGEERPDYLDSYSVKGLEIPPKLTSPDTSRELVLPKPSDQALQALKARDDLTVKGSVAPVFTGLKLKSDQGLYWLEVNQDADQVWPLMLDFWSHEGIKLQREEPLLGLMETEWIKEFDPNRGDSFIATMFSKLSPDFLDKFRLRVERLDDQGVTRIFISHRGLEIFSEGDVSTWQQRASNPELEREMLYRLVLFAGLTKLNADEVFETYLPYQSRIRALQEEDTYEVIGEKDFVWQRVLHALDRIGVDITEKNKAQGSITVVVDNVPEKLVTSDDELNESSWLVRLFMGGGSDEELEEGTVTIDIALTPVERSTKMQLTHDGDALPNIGLAWRFKEAMEVLLK